MGLRGATLLPYGSDASAEEALRRGVSLAPLERPVPVPKGSVAMPSDRNPDVETPRKVITFPPPAPEGGANTADAAGVNARTRWRRQQRLTAWFEGLWALLAWVLAASRLRWTVAHREVFGPEAVIAFVLVVSMLLLRGPRSVAMLVRAARALRSATAVRGAAEREGSGTPLPDARRGRPRKRGGRKS